MKRICGSNAFSYVGCCFYPKSVIRGICFVVVNVIYRLTGSCKLKFLMTAIRSLNFQYAWFQHVTRNTTKMGFSNDRFGINDIQQRKYAMKEPSRGLFMAYLSYMQECCVLLCSAFQQGLYLGVYVLHLYVALDRSAVAVEEEVCRYRLHVV